MGDTWSFMAHGQGFLQEIATSSDRGQRQLGSVNWVMLEAGRPAGGGLLTLRLMTSLELLTVGRCGYPDLAQSGESCRGVPLHDRQHPHDLFMETAARYTRPIGGATIDVYGGPVGEPALGPTAFAHRPSAMPNPIAPIGHHWLDSTHVSFGVVTAGVGASRWKIEASAFNGREPDDRRYDFDLGRLDSWAGRVSWMPAASVSAQLSTGRLRDVEHDSLGALDERRTTASVIYHRRMATRLWATTIAWGRNAARGEASQEWLAETAVDVTRRDLIFARAEWTQKSFEDLAIDGPDAGVAGVLKIEGGYTRWIAASAGVRVGIGGVGGFARLPADMAASYGTSTPLEAALFLRVTP